MSEGRYSQRIAVWRMNGRLEQGEKADILSRSTTAPSRPSFQRKTSLVDRRKTSYREFRHSQILVSLQAGGGFHDCFGDLVETHFNPNLLKGAIIIECECVVEVFHLRQTYWIDLQAKIVTNCYGILKTSLWWILKFDANSSPAHTIRLKNHVHDKIRPSTFVLRTNT